MSREVRRKYAINFDLKIADLEKYYSVMNYDRGLYYGKYE